MNKKLTPYFPEHIFGGIWAGRPNLHEVRPPDFDDYVKLSLELQATQQFILQNFDNLKALPDTLTKLQEVADEAENIREKLKEYPLPAALDANIKNVESKLDDMAASIDKIRKVAASIALTQINLEERIKKIEDAWRNDVTAFQNYNRGEFARLRDNVQNELNSLRQELQLLRTILAK